MPQITISKLSALLLSATLLLCPFIGHAALVWRPGEGWTNEDESGNSTAASSRAQIELARKLEAAADWQKARQAYAALVRKWPFSFNAGEAQYKIGWCAEKAADFGAAFKAYQKCIEKHPESKFYNQSLERQYNIANLYLAGEPQRLWKIPIPLQAPEKIVEMYDQIIKNAPYGQYAPQSQFKIGLAHEKQRKWSEAVKAYQMVLDRYPGNDVADDAQYQIGYAWMRAAGSSDYDQGATEKAIDAFTEFITRYPNSEKVVQAEENIVDLKTRTSQGAFHIAQFYESQKRYEAAIIYYEDVLKREPETERGKIAREKIAQLSSSKVVGPEPPKNLAKLEDKTVRRLERQGGELPAGTNPDSEDAMIGPSLEGITLPDEAGITQETTQGAPSAKPDTSKGSAVPDAQIQAAEPTMPQVETEPATAPAPKP
jgi:outer membrane protein assembly factor BamD